MAFQTSSEVDFLTGAVWERCAMGSSLRLLALPSVDSEAPDSIVESRSEGAGARSVPFKVAIFCVLLLRKGKGMENG